MNTILALSERQSRKPWLFTLLAGILLVPLAGFAATDPVRLPAPQHSPVVPLDRIIAVVNDQTISQSQLNAAIAQIKTRMQSANVPLPPAQELQTQVLNQLIYRSLQLQVAKRNNVTVTQEQLNQAIDRVAEQNKMTVAQLKAAVQKEGMSLDEFYKQIREELIIGKLQQDAIGQQIRISPDEVAQFMKSYHSETDARTEYQIQDILIALPETPSSSDVQAAEQKAQTILKKLRAGANFSQLAMADSADQHALDGGNLGWRTLAAMPTLFANAVAGKTTGAIAGPIRAPNGFHLLKVAAIRNPNKQSVTQDQARDILFQRKFQEQLQTWLQQLHDSAYIKILLNQNSQN